MIFLQKLLMGFLVLRIWNDTFHGTEESTLGLIIGSHALGAQARIDDVDGIALADGIVGAIGDTGVAGDALLTDHQCHGNVPFAGVGYGGLTPVNFVDRISFISVGIRYGYRFSGIEWGYELRPTIFD